ncbi:MAG: hypothetical protein LBU22_02600 [Dysgonamonadaceae bacterium]|jgi:uncharacterized low-complexity protein|nr:hypothetical protein [Dysgonamonadaceae bacterium]
MKKVLLSAVMVLALTISVSLTVMAQDKKEKTPAKVENSDKKECCSEHKSEGKDCCAEKKSDAKAGETKACCAEKKSDAKASSCTNTEAVAEKKSAGKK